MSLFSTVIWKLKSGEQKLKLLKKRGLVIGGGCEVLNGYEFGSEPYLVRIGNNVRFAPGVRIATHDGGCWVLRNLYPELAAADRFGRVEIGNNCHIGMNATVLPGVRIGDNCIIGACAVVTHDIPSNTVAAGVPARPICTIEQYRDKHLDEIVMTKGMSWDDKRSLVEGIFEKKLS